MQSGNLKRILLKNSVLFYYSSFSYLIFGSRRLRYFLTSLLTSLTIELTVRSKRIDAAVAAIRRTLARYKTAFRLARWIKPHPKGMHCTTYERLFIEYIKIEGSHLDRIAAIDELVKSRKQQLNF